MQWLWPDAYRFPPIVASADRTPCCDNCDPILHYSCWRVLQRAYCVWRLHGYRQAVLSIPRMAWANIVNLRRRCGQCVSIYAICTPAEQSRGHKTDHIYPVLESIPFLRPPGEAHANGTDCAGVNTITAAKELLS